MVLSTDCCSLPVSACTVAFWKCVLAVTILLASTQMAKPDAEKLRDWYNNEVAVSLSALLNLDFSEMSKQ